MRPGQTYDLVVRTARGEEARARTTVPGEYSIHGIRTASRTDQREPTCALPPDTPLPVRWSPSPGAWGYLAPLTIFGLSGTVPASYNPPDPMELLGVSVSAATPCWCCRASSASSTASTTTRTCCASCSGGLPDGTAARVVVAAADRNYVNGVRGGTFNPSGQVRISSVVGDGVGVFGSLAPLAFTVDVGAAGAQTPPCIVP